MLPGDQHPAAAPGCQELRSLLQELDASCRTAACFGCPAAVGLAERAPSPSPRSRGSISPFSPYFSLRQNDLSPSSPAGTQGVCGVLTEVDNLTSFYLLSGNWVSRAARWEQALAGSGAAVRGEAASSEPGLIQPCQALRCCGHRLLGIASSWKQRG